MELFDVGSQISMKEAQFQPGQPAKLSLTENLTRERARLQVRMAEIDEVLAALRANPQVEQVIDLIFKHGLRQMVKLTATARDGSGKKLIGFGLSRGNLTKLTAGQPILF